ncbi:MAG TPA: hypothetical protein VFO86_00455, partial [Terriglobia bacterium]|nr:hypothetical protein [Terriglobia bacterium]
QGARRGTSDRLTYDYVTDQVTLFADKGSEVTIDDPANQSIRNATWAQWTSRNGQIEARNELGEKVVSKPASSPAKAK